MRAITTETRSKRREGLSDTSPDALRVQISVLRRLGTARRFGLVRTLSRQSLRLARGASRLSIGGIESSNAAGYPGGIGRVEGPDGITEESGRMEPDLLAVLALVVDAFGDLGIAYRIGGSVASSAYGVPRSTLGIDLVAELRDEDAAALAARLRGTFYADEARIREATARTASFNLIHLGSGLKIDVFVAGSTPYDRSAFGRVRDEVLEEGSGRRFRLVAPEDVVLNKLAWFRQGGGVSERQWQDVIGVLRVQAGALDTEYLRRWAATLGLVDLLEEAFAAAGC